MRLEAEAVDAEGGEAWCRDFARRERRERQAGPAALLAEGEHEVLHLVCHVRLSTTAVETLAWRCCSCYMLHFEILKIVMHVNDSP